MTKPREWEITREGIVTDTGTLSSEAVRVVEAEPVERELAAALKAEDDADIVLKQFAARSKAEREEMLDLLEKARQALGARGLTGEIEEFLRKHGRLSDD
jgi:hypothetical protein